MINPSHLNKLALLYNVNCEIDIIGGNENNLELLDHFFCQYEPILDNRIVFTPGGTGVVNYELPFYKITTISDKKFKPGQFIQIQNLYFEIYKILKQEQPPLLVKYLICREKQYDA